MFKTETQETGSSLHPSLDLFSANTTVCGVETARLTEVSLVSGPDVRPYEFRILNSPAFLDLQRSYILTRYKIVDEDDNDITTEDANEVYAPVNMIGTSLFKQIQVQINGVVTHDNSNFPYRSFIGALLSYNSEYKSSFLRLAGYSPEEDPTSVNDPEYKKRAKACAKSKVLETITPLWFEPATQPKAILPFIDFRLLCFPSPDEFLIDRRKGAKKCRLKVVNMTLMLREMHVHDSVALAFNNVLQSKGSVTYSSMGSNARSFYVPPGIREFPTFRLFSNNIPRRVFFTLVDANAFNGNYTNPFVFRNFGLQDVRLETAGEVYPFHQFALSYDKGIYAKAYVALQDALSVSGSGCSNGITPEIFASHAAIYAFDCSGVEGDNFMLQRLGETTIKLTFDKDTPASGLYGLAIGEFVTNLVIDKDRNPRVY